MAFLFLKMKNKSKINLIMFVKVRNAYKKIGVWPWGRSRDVPDPEILDPAGTGSKILWPEPDPLDQIQ